MLGGAISASGGTLTVLNSRFTTNQSSFSGGAISATNRTTHAAVSVTKTTFDHNLADGAGAINFADANGAMVVADSAFVENTGENPYVESGTAGGIFNRGTVVVTNTTFARNEGLDGGALENVGTMTVINSTLSDNLTYEAAGAIFTFLYRDDHYSEHDRCEHDSGTNRCANSRLRRCLTSLGNNLIGDPTGCLITLMPSDLTGGAGLAPLLDDGTPGNGHYPLLDTSVAINAGNNDVCLNNTLLTADQIGNPRVGACDIGAIEFQASGKKRRAQTTSME